MALFPLRSKEEESEQLIEIFPHSLINVSAELYNALARATIREMGERKVRLVTMDTMRRVEAECYREDSHATVFAVPRRGEKVHLYLSVIEVEEQRDRWECAVTSIVLFPIDGSGDIERKNRFLELLISATRISGRIEGGGLAVRVMLYGDDVPVERKNPDERYGKAYRYFVRKREVR